MTLAAGPIFGLPYQTVVDIIGTPIPGALLFFYEQGSSTLATVYSDPGLTVPLTNPVPAGANGRFPIIFLDGETSYKAILTDSSGDLNDPIWTADPANYLLAATTLSFIAPGTNPKTQTVQERLAKSVLLTDYEGGVGDGLTVTTDAWINALAECALTGQALYVPGCTDFYLLDDEITVPDGIKIWGDGYTSRVKQTVIEKNNFIAGDFNTFEDMNIEGIGDQTAPVAFTKENGIFQASGKGLNVTNCYFHGFNSTSVQMRNCTDIRITNNICWDGYYDVATGPDSGADILAYGDTLDARMVIQGNLCLSNNSQGIYVNAQGYSRDIVISGNVCVALQNWVECPLVDLQRRSGIVCSYGGGPEGGRTAVTGNICRNTNVHGIYAAQGTAGGSGIALVGNICSLNGRSATVDYTLGGGISCNGMNASTLIEGNSIVDYQGPSAGVVGAITLNFGISGDQNQCDVIGNTVRGSTTNGLSVKGYPNSLSIRNNRFYDSADNDVTFGAIFGGTSRIDIEGNTFWRTNADNYSIYAYTGNFTTIRRLRIHDNRFIGYDKTVSGATNSAIFAEHSSIKFSIKDNYFENFKYGVYVAFGVTGRQLTNYLIEDCEFYNMDTAVVLRGLDPSALVPVYNCVFDTVTTKFDAAGYYDCAVAAQRLGVSNLILQGSAAGDMPNGVLQVSGTATTLGTLAQGDVIWNKAMAAGGSPGWGCTTAGSPSTPMVVKVMGNLAA